MNESVVTGLQEGLIRNPFAITKAVDFSDKEIDEQWVEWPEAGGFSQFMNLTAPMAIIVKGGKGVGRTHILRHFSAQVQAIRGRDSPLSEVQRDGVLGIYTRCGGLNGSRFQGRGIGSEAWESIFAQYTDVWLAQAVLDAVVIATSGNPLTSMQQRSIIEDVGDLLLDSAPLSDAQDLHDVQRSLLSLQRGLDRAIADAGLGRPLPTDFRLQSVRGGLAFGLPLALREHYPPLSDTMFLYLLDELENFTEDQQRYVQTLLRERPVGVSFVLGVRTSGLRTLRTLSADEENKRGSEFDEIDLDRRYLAAGKRTYQTFCVRLVSRRLTAQGLVEDLAGTDRHSAALDRLRGLFEVSQPEQEEQWAVDHYPPDQRPYLNALRDKLTRAESTAESRLEILGNIDFIVNSVRVPSRPLLEKVNIFLLYRAWARGRSLREMAERFLSAGNETDPVGAVVPTTAQRAILGHYSADLRAQLCNDMSRPQTYSGIDRFIVMSGTSPRNLLVILKNIYRWAAFNGETPFQGKRISLDSQRLGVLEAARWFLEDAMPAGEDGEDLKAAVHRLGEMFRRFRFSDKPVESSLVAFSADLTACSQVARRMVTAAADRSLLIQPRGGQKERNTGIVEAKLQLHPLLSPLWDLPTARRGAVRLTPEETNAIFDPAHSGEFAAMVHRRRGRMIAPFQRPTARDDRQRLLEFED